MSPSSPVRTRQSRRAPTPTPAGSNRSPRSDTYIFVARSAFLVVAAVSVVAASDYLAYLIGRKQVTYEELRRQVGLFGQVIDQKRADEDLTGTVPKLRQDRFEQHGSALTDLTTSTINGKTAVAPEPAPARAPKSASLTDAPAVAPPARAAQPPPSQPNVATKHRVITGVAHQRTTRKQKGPPTSATPRQGAASSTNSEPSRDLPAAAPDSGLAGQ